VRETNAQAETRNHAQQEEQRMIDNRLHWSIDFETYE
jgi:hypothetical protein